MRRTVLAALTFTIAALSTAKAADAAVIYQISGTVNSACDCSDAIFQVGSAGVFSAPVIFTPGTYTYTLTIDPKAVSSINLNMYMVDSWQMYVDGAMTPDGDDEIISIPQESPYFVETSTGFTGYFTIPPVTINPPSHGYPGDYERDIYQVSVGLYGTIRADAGTQDYRFVIASVPEPSTWAMLLTGFLGLGAALRHRKARGEFSQQRLT